MAEPTNSPGGLVGRMGEHLSISSRRFFDRYCSNILKMVISVINRIIKQLYWFYFTHICSFVIDSVSAERKGFEFSIPGIVKGTTCSFQRKSLVILNSISSI